jgi:hypothetical protein
VAASVAVIVTVGDPQSWHSRAPLRTWMVVVAPSGIPGGDLQRRDVTVVDLVQCGIALLLLGLDLGDVRVKGTPLFVDDRR